MPDDPLDMDIPGLGDTVEEIDIPDALPQLMLRGGDLPAAVRELRDLLAASGALFERGRALVRVQPDANGALYVHALTVSNVVMGAHAVCQPVKMTEKGVIVPTTLPDRVAQMYLELGEWGVAPLAGITSAPLLRPDGAIVTAGGYDDASQMFCDASQQIADLAVPDRPTQTDAAAALHRLRESFCTFPFADAALVARGALQVVDLDQPPALSESSFLAALLTGVARPSLWLAPGVMIQAPNVSGAGSGKGLLARAITVVAYGLRPSAFTAGDAVEFDKRIGAALNGGRAVVFIDNANDRTLRSETLASAITERPAEVRLLGQSKMTRLNSAALIVLTGNGTSIAEDLVRRLLQVSIDPRVEDPESRPFKAGFLDDIAARRGALLADVLTILRWGRHNADRLQRGQPLGSFEQWAQWVRDPLLTLGCADPVAAMRQAKQRDPRRQNLTELFVTWDQHHSSDWVTVAGLHDDVRKLLDPNNKGRQFVATKVQRLVDTRLAGFVLHRDKSSRRAAAQYRLVATDTETEADDAAGPEAGPEAAPRPNGRTSWDDPAYLRRRQADLSRRVTGYEDRN